MLKWKSLATSWDLNPPCPWPIAVALALAPPPLPHTNTFNTWPNLVTLARARKSDFKLRAHRWIAISARAFVRITGALHVHSVSLISKLVSNFKLNIYVALIRSDLKLFFEASCSEASLSFKVHLRLLSADLFTVKYEVSALEWFWAKTTLKITPLLHKFERFFTLKLVTSCRKNNWKNV